MNTESKQMQQPIHTTLSDAALHWGDADLLAELQQAVQDGHTGVTLGSVCPEGESALERMRDQYCKVLDYLRLKLIEKLKAEELVAIAFSSASSPGTAREPIHPGRWRILAPNFDDNTARGGGLELFDILVTTPAREYVIMPDKPIFILSDGAKTVRLESRAINLQRRTYQLLRLLASRALARHPVVSHDDIYNMIFAQPTLPSAVRDLIRELRLKLEPLEALVPGKGKIVENRSQQGYSLSFMADQISIEP